MALPTLQTRNVTSAFRAASQDDRTAGAEWYARARRLADELDPTDPTRAAAVLAVLSPRTSWPLNVRYARQAYALLAAGDVDSIRASADGGRITTTRDSAGKVRALLVDRADPSTVVSGPKVTAFWLTIVDPTDPRAVVVDRHAYDIAVGRVTDDATRTAGLAGKRYDGACTLYRRAARILSRETGEPITPSMVQAVTWCYWRRTHALAFHQDAVSVDQLTLAV